MRERGYVEGKMNLNHHEYRWGESDYARLPALAAELRSLLNVDLILHPMVHRADRAAKEATTDHTHRHRHHR
jgi:hypothetical protein